MEAEAPTVPVEATPTETNSAPTPNPLILCRMPFLQRNPPNLSWLGTDTDLCWLAYPVAWLIHQLLNKAIFKKFGYNRTNSYTPKSLQVKTCSISVTGQSNCSQNQLGLVYILE